jgi:hypothetical protein
MSSEMGSRVPDREARYETEARSSRPYQGCRETLTGGQDFLFDDDGTVIAARGTDEGWAQPARYPERGGNGLDAFESDRSAVPRCECEPSVPTRGTFLDETIDLRDPEGDELTSGVMAIVGAQRASTRQRRATDVENERSLTRSILANGLRCHWHRQPSIVSYLRKADGYSGKLNKPVWLSGRALGRQVDLLAEAGLVDVVPGERETSSGYILTARLLDLIDRYGVSIHSLRRVLDREDLVRLKKARPGSTFDEFERKLIRHKGDRIYFEPTAQTEAWRDDVAAFNDFLTGQDIDIQPPAELIEQWTIELNEDKAHTGGRIYKPELFRKAVYRVFNDGNPDQPTFDLGGRLAGGFWMNAPREVRRFITINGQSTTELDYATCHPRMLYHERGLECPDDLYDIPEVTELEQAAGMESGSSRSGVKWIFQVLINGKRRPSDKDRPTDIVLPPDVKPSDLTKIIEARHKPIADAFRTGAGLRLMKEESEIALAVVTKAREQGWLALPVHDSFVTAVDHREQLRLLMIEEYINRYQQPPSIKQSF